MDSSPVVSYNGRTLTGECEVDCPNCGVYNPEERQVCWRCDRELPKPKEPKKKRTLAATQRRMWIIVGLAVIVWLLLTWLIPLLLGGSPAP